MLRIYNFQGPTKIGLKQLEVTESGREVTLVSVQTFRVDYCQLELNLLKLLLFLSAENSFFLNLST